MVASGRLYDNPDRLDVAVNGETVVKIRASGAEFLQILQTERTAGWVCRPVDRLRWAGSVPKG
jgi:hypothetical protein